MNERLWEAVRLNHVEDCLSLLRFDVYGDLAAQVNSKGLNDWTALHIAADGGSADVCRALVQSAEETDIEAITTLHQTPLHLAAAKGFLDVIQILVTAGGNINAQDYTGCTALHLVAKNGHVETGTWLLGQDPNVTILDEDGKTAYQESVSREIAEVFEMYFRERGIPFERIKLTGEIIPVEQELKDQIDRMMVAPSTRPKALRLFIDHLKKPMLNLLEQSRNRRNSSPANTTMATQPVQWADFVPKCLLGRGSFGAVYLVAKKLTGELFAMKVLSKASIRDQDLMKYAVAERNVLSYVSHPFIVGLNYAFQTPEKLVLILDYCPGGDLETVLNREKRLPEDIARLYLCEILLALEELHSHDIIYRDLKPSNVLLDSQGHAVLTDFGLCKEHMNEDVVAESFCGSQVYLAPEVLLEQGHTKSVDWYLFGTLAYELLVGAPPYIAKTVKELYKNIKNARLKIPKYVSPVACDLIEKLLNRNPRERLGAGPTGAQEVKTHPFFAEVDWGVVMRRQLRPPLPMRSGKKIDEEIDLEEIYGKLDVYEPDSLFEGWAYTHSSS